MHAGNAAGNAAGEAVLSGDGRDIAVPESQPVHTEGAAACACDVGCVVAGRFRILAGGFWRGSARLGARAARPPRQNVPDYGVIRWNLQLSTDKTTATTSTTAFELKTKLLSEVSTAFDHNIRS